MTALSEHSNRDAYVDLIKRSITNYEYLGGEASFENFRCVTHYDLIESRWKIDPLARRVQVAGEPVDLTVKEYDLLLILARHPGRSFSRAYLLDQVWGEDYDGGDRTVDTHIVRLRRKLGDMGERISTVWGVGYRLE